MVLYSAKIDSIYTNQIHEYYNTCKTISSLRSPCYPAKFQTKWRWLPSKQSSFHSPLPGSPTPIARRIRSSHNDVAMVQSGDALVATTV